MIADRSQAFVSVIVPTLNRAELLRDCLRDLQAQEYPRERFEIIVVDDGSSDTTADVVRGAGAGLAPAIRYLGVSHGGLNAARNVGIEAARGDTICFVDDDAGVPPGWLAALLEGMGRHPDSACFGGPVRMRFEVPPPRICEMESWRGESALDCGPDECDVPHVVGCNMAIRRWAIDKAGFFDASMPLYGDETEWQRRLTRAGAAITYIPAAWVWHRRTAADLRPFTMLRRRFRRGAGYVEFAFRVGEPVILWPQLWPIPFYLLHAVRRRCFGAVLEVAKTLGVTWGVVSRRLSRPGGRRRSAA
jgi:glycosyltransferase involved in cell wall biosynthesis